MSHLSKSDSPSKPLESEEQHSSRQKAQLGDGMPNFIFQTNGALIAIHSVAGIPYLKWLRFFGPLYLILIATAVMLVSIASMIGYGPF